MSPRFWRIVRYTTLPLVAVASILSCQNTTVIEDDLPSGPGKHYVHFLVTDTPAIPDSIWFRTPMDSGTWAFSVNPAQVGRYVNFLPVIHQLGERDSMSIHAFRLGMHTGIYNVKEVNYMELGAQHLVRTSADSLAVKLLRVYDSLRKTDSVTYQSTDTTLAGRTKLFQQVAAKLMFEGHPASSAYLRVAPVGLDTASVHRQILTLAAKSGLTLGEVVRQWNLRMDYATARQALASMALDSQSVNPFRIETALALDSLLRGEPAVGLRGKISGKKGILSVSYSVTNDSGDRTDRFVLADFPGLKSEPKDLDFAGHPTFAPRANALAGSYTLRILVKDALGNEQSYATPFQVGAELDHTGPSLTVLSPASAVVRDYADSQLVVRVEAKDASGVRSVKIGGKDASKGVDGNWSTTLNVPVVAASQLVKIEATDLFGNDSSLQIQIRRNPPVPPSATLVEPLQGSWIPFDTTQVLVVWHVQAGTGRLDSVHIDNAPASCDAQGACRRMVSLPVVGKSVSIPLKAWNSLGLSVSDNVTFGRKADSAGPALALQSPVPGTQVAFDVASVELTVGASDLSGVDSVVIANASAQRQGNVWKQSVRLGQPGEIARIQVSGWDRAGNRTDSVFLVSRAPVPGSLPPSVTWLNPATKTGTIFPFDSTGLWVRVRLFDLSGIDTASVKIGGKAAQVMPDSVWTARIDLPANGAAQVISLELKNTRGVLLSDLATATRRQDTVRMVALSDTISRLRSGSFWVKLVCATPGATIRYTLDGTDPTELSPKFKDSIKIDTTLTLRTKGFATDRVSSATTVQNYQLALPVEVIPGSWSTMFRQSDGSLWASGDNDGFTFSPNSPPPYWPSTSTTIYYRPTKIADSVVQATFSASSTLWVKADHSLWGLGDNKYGELGDGTYVDRNAPILIARDIARVSGNQYSYHTLVLKRDSSLWITGVVAPDRKTNQLLPVASHVRTMQAGDRESWILQNDGTLWSIDHTSPLGTGSSPSLKRISDSVVVIPTSNSWTGDVFLFVKQDGTVWGYGANLSGSLGTGDRNPVPKPIHLTSFDGLGVQQISIGDAHALFTTRSGDVYATGSNTGGEFDPLELFRPGLIHSQASSASAGVVTSFFLFQNGSLYGQGFDDYGQLGTGILTRQGNGFTRIRF